VLLALGVAAITWQLSRRMLPTHLYDYASVHPDALEATFNFNYAWLRERFGVDARVVLLDDPTVTDLDAFAVNEARRLRVGDRESGQGLLVVLNYGTRLMRIEVGPRLQGTFTDAFTGYLLRNHVGHFTDRREAEVGMRSLWHLILHRTLQSVAGDEWDPTELERVRDSTRLAAGGGAATTMEGGTRDGGKLPESVRRELSPQPTPEALLDAYRRWVGLDPIDTDVGIFTDRSRRSLAGNPYTRPFQDVEFWKVHNRPYQFIVRDNLAIMFTTTTPLIPPSLMVRSDSGWRLDVDSEWHHLIPMFKTPFTWGWVGVGDAYDRAFADVLYPVDQGIMRLIPGNNRPLPVRKTRWE
jgi:hypothetical protein